MNETINRGPFDLYDNRSAEIARLLAPVYDTVISVNMLQWHEGSKGSFLALHEFLDVPYYDAPLAERVQVAVQMTTVIRCRAHPNPTDMIRSTICRGALEPLLPAVNRIRVSTKQGEDLTLLHAVADAIGTAVFFCSRGYKELCKDLAGSVPKTYVYVII